MTRGSTGKQTRRPRGIAEPRGDRAFYATSYAVLTLFCLAVLFPLIYVISSSFSSAEAINSGAVVLFPVDPNVEAYQQIAQAPGLVRGVLNSLLYAVLGGFIGTALTLLAAYPLSRDEFPFRRGLTLFFLIPSLFSAGIIPTYLIVRQLGLLNTVWALVLPGAMSIFNMLITMTFYRINVPKELVEAGRIDGADDFAMFWRIAIPLSKPIIAVNLLFYAVGQWNGWFNAFLYLSNTDLYPLQLILRNLLAQSNVDPASIGGGDIAEIVRRRELFDRLKYAMIVIAMIPPLIAYPFVQKHFIKGALIGSIK